MMKTTKFLPIVCGIALMGVLAIGTMARQSDPAPASGSSAAQSGKGPGRMNPDAPEEDAALNLTDDQKTKIAAIRADTKDQMKAIQKDTTLTDDARQQQIKALRKTTRAQVWAVMTPDQQKQWAAEARAKREAKRQDGAAPSDPQ
jgi:Spy/CpxP family protein refolding chaperone